MMGIGVRHDKGVVGRNIVWVYGKIGGETEKERQGNRWNLIKVFMYL